MQFKRRGSAAQDTCRECETSAGNSCRFTNGSAIIVSMSVCPTSISSQEQWLKGGDRITILKDRGTAAVKRMT